MSKWLLINPPTGKYIRDTRCQASVDDIFAITERPPIDLAYIAGAITKNEHNCCIIDCPVEGVDWYQLEQYIYKDEIAYIVINTTMFSYKEDLKACTMCKKINKKIVTIAKGAIFFNNPRQIMIEYPDLDIAVSAEEEFVFSCISNNNVMLDKVPNIIYRKHDEIIINSQIFNHDLKLPVPSIELINHKLYKRPDKDEMQASIVVGRGCPGQCIYCVAPMVGGRSARYRSVNEIISEIKLYYEKYNITNFYFSADTFTFNHRWVKQFCEAILNLDFQIAWLCTARADSITEDIISIIKEAGCWGVSIGIETGDEEIQKKIRKNLTVETIDKAIKLCRKYKIVTLLHFIIGFPWDNDKTIRKTIKLAKRLKGNIIEFYIATPLPGTELFDIVSNNAKLMYKNSINRLNQVTATYNTYYVNSQELVAYRKKALRSIYFNPFFYLNSLKYISSWKQFINCARFLLVKFRKIIYKRKE